jgi:uncharacterized protein (TIGR03067 family)
MFLIRVILACVLLFVFQADTVYGAWEDNKMELEGEWVSTVTGLDVTVTFSGDHFSVAAPTPNYWYKGTFKLDTDSDPKKIDLAIKEAGIPQYVGRTSLGIYKIEEGILVMTINQPGAPNYPSSFKSSGAVVFKLKKK